MILSDEPYLVSFTMALGGTGSVLDRWAATELAASELERVRVERLVVVILKR